MSKCISLKGEYSEHTFDPSTTEGEFVCTYCFVFDEGAALAEIDRLQKVADKWCQRAIEAEAEVAEREVQITRLEEGRDRLRAQMAAVEALHQPAQVGPFGICDDDEQTWPCSTRRAALGSEVTE